jgi:hypothetical protein
VRDRELVWPEPPYEFYCHHFGYVRHASRLRQKWRSQNTIYESRRFKLPIPGVVFDLFPHRWEDPDIVPHLRLYEGPYIKAVRDNPSEFVRDGLRLCRLVKGPLGRPERSDSASGGQMQVSEK